MKIAVIDDDPSMLDILQDLYSESDIVDIKYTYTEPRKFIQEVAGLNFDLCFLDISMPGMDGLVIAQLLKNRPYIFITGSEDKLKDALRLDPIDVITKPFTKERIDHALDKAYKLIVKNIEYALFSVAENARKVNLHLPDIIFVDTDDIDPRHKDIVLKDGTRYTIMDCSLDELLSFAGQLVQVNRRQLISLDYINDMEYDSISVKDTDKINLPSEITLSRKYKKEVPKKIYYR